MIKKTVILICIAVISLIVARFLVLHQVDPKALDAIAEGSSDQEVEMILGKPTSVETNASQWTKWHYRRAACVYCEVVLDFDSHGRYRGRFHDH